MSKNYCDDCDKETKFTYIGLIPNSLHTDIEDDGLHIPDSLKSVGVGVPTAMCTECGAVVVVGMQKQTYRQKERKIVETWEKIGVISTDKKEMLIEDIKETYSVETKDKQDNGT